MPTLTRGPIVVNLDRPREIVFNLNTEVIIQSAGKRGADLWKKIGEEKDPETGELKDALDVNLENLRLYLWAALQDDMRAHGELLTEEQVGGLVSNKRKVTAVLSALVGALNRYYGRDTEELGEN